jgi:hypothetical protein
MADKQITSEDKSNFKLREYGGLVYPVVTRKKGERKIDECPYCGGQHTHGESVGHKMARCEKSYVREIEINGQIIQQGRGYFIEEY